jgi:hypothetical protein
MQFPARQIVPMHIIPEQHGCPLIPQAAPPLLLLLLLLWPPLLLPDVPHA